MECSNCELMGSLACRFPRATTIKFGSEDVWFLGREVTELTAALAALPTGCWPAVTSAGGHCLTPEAAAQLQRLCPRLTPCVRVSARQPSVAEALRALVPAARVVEGLELRFDQGSYVPGDAVRAGPALARLRNLRQLRLGSGTPACAAGLLPAALPALTALSMLSFDCISWDVPPPRLGPCPESLQRLEIRCMSEAQLHGILESAPSLAGITWLSLG